MRMRLSCASSQSWMILHPTRRAWLMLLWYFFGRRPCLTSSLNALRTLMGSRGNLNGMIPLSVFIMKARLRTLLPASYSFRIFMAPATASMRSMLFMLRSAGMVVEKPLSLSYFFSRMLFTVS